MVKNQWIIFVKISQKELHCDVKTIIIHWYEAELQASGTWSEVEKRLFGTMSFKCSFTVSGYMLLENRIDRLLRTPAPAV